jgi:general secretion pathway protein L
MAVLVLILPAQADITRASWALVEGEAVLADGQLTAGEIVQLPAGHPVSHAVALAPAEAVFLRRAPVPGANDRDARRAAPFLIEEQIAQPLEDVEAAVGAADDAGVRYIAAVDGALLASWRRLAAGLGVKPVHLVPDALVLPDVGADLVAFTYGERVLVRTRHASSSQAEGERDVEAAIGEPIALGLDADLAGSILPALAGHLAPRRVLVSEDFDPNLTAPDATPIALKRMAAPDLRLLGGQMSLERLASLPGLLGASFVSALDWAGMLRPWRSAALLAGVAVLATAIFAAGEAAYLDHRTNAFARAELETFEAAFPDTRVVNPQVQLRRALASVGAVEDRGGFLELAAGLAAIMEGNEDIRIDAIRFDADRAALSVSALYSDFDDFEALQTAAEARDIVLEDGGARQSASGVEGEFTVRLP